MKLEVFGTQVNIWGLYCAIGAVCAFASICVISGNLKMKKGTAPVLGVISIILGIICSRGVYCLFTTVTSYRMSLSAWIHAEEGGWSLFGMIGGVLLAGWFTAWIVGEKPQRTLDAAAIAIPLIIAAERFGEGSLQSFFSSREDLFNLNTKIIFSEENFLTVRNQNGIYLATYLIDAVLAMILFLILTLSLLEKRRQDGSLFIRFLLLCGAGGVLAESLRNDDYMVYSFVRIQQVMAAIILFAGVVLAGRRNGKQTRSYFMMSLVTMILTVAESIGIEFAHDRTMNVNHVLLYIVMIGALSIPVIHGLLMQQMRGDGCYPALHMTALKNVMIITVAISAAEVSALILELIRLQSVDVFMTLTTGSAASVLLIHCVALVLAFRIETGAENQING